MYSAQLHNNINEPLVQRYLNSKVTRTDIIQHLIDLKGRENVIYLELGVFQGENIAKIQAAQKFGIDPGAEGVVHPLVTHACTTDEFFDLTAGHDDIKFDVIFVDALHEYEQAYKDVINSLNHLADEGYIIMHDCRPTSELAQNPNRQCVCWNGDVWRSLLRVREERDVVVHTIDTDFGVAVLQVGKQHYPYRGLYNLSYKQFSERSKELLNLISPEEFFETYK